MRASDRERHALQDQVQKITSTLSESFHSLSNAHITLQRDAEEMMRETKRDRGRVEEALVIFKEEAQETKRYGRNF
jgi:hypothetical protein